MGEIDYISPYLIAFLSQAKAKVKWFLITIFTEAMEDTRLMIGATIIFLVASFFIQDYIDRHKKQ